MKAKDKRHWFRAALVAPGALRQVAAILGTSCVLGLAFNASNPIGIRWTGPEAVPEAEARADGEAVGADLAAVASAGASGLRSAEAARDEVVVAANEVAPEPTSTQAEPEAASYVPPSPTTWREVEPRHEVGQVVLVDARTKAEFDAGHIPGALWLPEPPSPEAMGAFRAAHGKDAHVVVYCSSTSCSLSFKLAHRLAKNEGFEFVQYMTGGYLEYQRAVNVAAGGATDASVKNTAAAAVDAPAAQPESQGRTDGTTAKPILASERRLDNAMPINWIHTKPLLKIGQVLLLDVRPKDRYDAGHIPGARWLRFDAESEEIERALADRSESIRVVAYCERTGCPQAFRLANRLLHDFDVRNVWFMVEGYEDWRESERAAGGPDSGPDA